MASCTEFIQTHFLDPESPGASQEMWSGCSLATNQTNLVASYATGGLTYFPHSRRFEGELRHYFTDRSWDDPRTFQIESNPFDPRRFDRTGIRIELQDTDQLAVTLTALSWGNA